MTRENDAATGEVAPPLRKGDAEQEYTFESGPLVSDTAALKGWLEESRGKRLRLPVVISAGAPTRMERASVGEIEMRVTDLALGVPLRERMAHKCGRGAERCALWLEGRFGEPHFGPDAQAEDLPQFEVFKVGDVIDESGADLRALRAE